MSVYNPYHFIPVGERTNQQKAQDIAREDAGQGSVTHERYVGGTHSGTIVCRLTTKTPVVVGANQTRAPGQYAEVTQYTGCDGRPAIPASSLRGMISSLAEAASNSAARILENRPYSFRKPFLGGSISALGMVIREHGALKLKPLALPTLRRTAQEDFEVSPGFRKIFPQPLFKTYIGGMKGDGSDSIRKDWLKDYATPPGQVSAWNMRQIAYNRCGNIDDDPRHLHCKDGRVGGRAVSRCYLVSQYVDGTAPIRDGYIRVLGCWGPRDAQIPGGKKHELWLPEPDPSTPAAAIHPEAIARFHALADERTEEDADLPFHPYGTARNEDPALGGKFRLKPYDIVYFDVDDNGVVREISLSAIWRGQVEGKNKKPAGAHAFFAAVDADLVPMHPRRVKLTLAERVFGFVEEDLESTEKPDDVASQKRLKAFASRVRFADATLAEGVSAEDAMAAGFVPLRILSSPKPPCPSLYFRPKSGRGWIPKIKLAPGEHWPQGRKAYLHHKMSSTAQPWVTGHPAEHADQKNSVRPIQREREFWFDVRFENLADAELGLLLYALAPSEEYHHKLGLGKPLGLGSVKIEVAAVFEIDRIKRYTAAGLRMARYTSAKLAPGERQVQWPTRYADLREKAEESADLLALRDKVLTDRLVTSATHAAIRALGDFAKAPASASIHTPTIAEQKDPEVDTYRWFVENEANHNALMPATDGLKPLP